MVEVTAKIDNGKTAETCVKDFGENLDDAIVLFTAEVVFANFRAQCIIGLQAFIRNQLRLVDENGKPTPVTGKALQKAVDSIRGVSSIRPDPNEIRTTFAVGKCT